MKMEKGKLKSGSAEYWHNLFWKEFFGKALNNIRFKNTFCNTDIEKFINEPVLYKSQYDLKWGEKLIRIVLKHDTRKENLIVELYSEPKNEQRLLFKARSVKDEIENALGRVVDIRAAKAKKSGTSEGMGSCIDTFLNIDVEDRSKWDEYIDWLMETSLKMKQIYDELF